MPDTPNIVFVHTDQQHHKALSAYGNEWLKTPHMDRIAKEGYNFMESVSSNPVCCPARTCWYTGRTSVNTLELVAEDGGFLYTADSYADELPYWLKTRAGPQLVVPYTLDANDMRFATPQGFNSGDQFYAYLMDSFDVLYAEGQAGAPKMMSVGLHCRLAGRPGRAAALMRFLDYIGGHSDVWVPRRIDIARHWHANFPHEET